ncbi:MAG: DTW domain-containing protein [Treponema sp.]|nr:DTW domain-containing protein [Treponema sp.]
MAQRCLKCFRPISHCLCEYAKPEIDSGIKFIFLMHPKEAKHQRTGTGRLSHIALKDSEIIVGLDFSKNEYFLSLINDKKYFPVLMYPGDDAWTARRAGFKEAAEGRQLLVIIIDATWFCSRKIIEHNQFLLELPRVSFYGEYRSIFTFKREPRPEYISTIETCYYFIKELQSVYSDNADDDARNCTGDAMLSETARLVKDCDPEPLMNVFKAMIKDQLQCENDRIAGKLPDVYAHDWKYKDKKPREIPDVIL